MKEGSSGMGMGRGDDRREGVLEWALGREVIGGRGEGEGG